MKKTLLLAFICITAILVSNGLAQFSEKTDSQNSSINKKTNAGQPILLELFTSQSCAACPSAEKMFTKMELEQPFKNVELITLAFHVDYRDTLSWSDKYASSLFTQRQYVYDRKFRTGQIYTPQMVMDGDIEFPGSHMVKAIKAAEKLVKNDKADIDLSIKEERLNIRITNIPEHDDATIYLAIAEDGISTRVGKGENAGKELGHASLVRRLNGLKLIASNEKSIEFDTNFQIQPDWKKENIKLVVFIQENGSRIIRGVARIPLEVTNVDRKS